MFLNPTLSAALDRIAERAADVRRAFTPGAVPQHDDVATPSPQSNRTLDPLSVAPPDGTYFVATDARGRTAYTRDGSFSIHDGVLVDPAGRPLQGVSTASGATGELRIDPVDASLGRVRDARIEPDGSFAYSRSAIDPRSGVRETQRVVVGRLSLARFPAGTKLDADDPTASYAPAGVVPHTGVAGDASFAALRPFERERSRVDLDQSLVRLKDAYIAFDALQAAQTAKGHAGKTVMDLIK
jgi:flagellar basal body rod protein FlgG